MEKYFGLGINIGAGFDLPGQAPLDYRVLYKSWNQSDLLDIPVTRLYVGMVITDAATATAKILKAIPAGATNAYQCTWETIGTNTNTDEYVKTTTTELGTALYLAGKKTTADDIGHEYVNASIYMYSGELHATSFIKDSGNSNGFLKADGAVDTNSYASSNHTHNTSILATLSSSQIDLANNTTYKLTTGGTSIVFKTPNGGGVGTDENVKTTTSTDTIYLSGKTTTDNNTGLEYVNSGVYMNNGSLYASKFIIPNGTSSLFLKADGTVDTNSYSKTNHSHSITLNGNDTVVNTDLHICAPADPPKEEDINLELEDTYWIAKFSKDNGTPEWYNFIEGNVSTFITDDTVYLSGRKKDENEEFNKDSSIGPEYINNNVYMDNGVLHASSFVNDVLSNGFLKADGTVDTNTYATNSHTHNTSILATSSNSQIDLANDTKYKLTAGGTSIVFKTPSGGVVTDEYVKTTTTELGTALYLAGKKTTADNIGHEYVNASIYMYSGELHASSFIIDNGHNNGFLKADGAVDTNSYASSNHTHSIKLNGSTTNVDTTNVSICAPSTIGTSGLVLKSSGNGAPTWSDALLTDQNVKVHENNNSTYNFPIMAINDSDPTNGNTYEALYNSNLYICPAYNQIGNIAFSDKDKGNKTYIVNIGGYAGGNYENENAALSILDIYQIRSIPQSTTSIIIGEGALNINVNSGFIKFGIILPENIHIIISSNDISTNITWDLFLNNQSLSQYNNVFTSFNKGYININDTINIKEYFSILNVMLNNLQSIISFVYHFYGYMETPEPDKIAELATYIINESFSKILVCIN